MTSVMAPPRPPTGRAPSGQAPAGQAPTGEPPTRQPPVAHPVVRFLASLSGALDRLSHVPIWSMTGHEQRVALVELAKQQSRLKELELQLLLQGERDDIGADSGAVSAPAWLAHATKTTTSSRHRDLHLATKLDGQFGATREALATGLIDVEKASVITAAVESLTEEHDDLPLGTRKRAEAHLIEQACAFDAPTLR